MSSLMGIIEKKMCLFQQGTLTVWLGNGRKVERSEHILWGLVLSFRMWVLGSEFRSIVSPVSAPTS